MLDAIADRIDPSGFAESWQAGMRAWPTTAAAEFLVLGARTAASGESMADGDHPAQEHRPGPATGSTN